MPFLKPAALAACAIGLGLVACKPSAAGLCAASDQCSPGAFCAAERICLAKPVVAIQPPLAWVGPAQPTVVVKVDAPSNPTLSSLTVRAETSAGTAVATGTLQAAVVGQNTVNLANFTAGIQQQATLIATLEFPDAAGTPQQADSPGVAAKIDSAPPLVQLTLPAPADAVNGYVARTGADLIVKALLTDQGSGPARATLQLNPCPAGAPACTFTGVAEGPAVQGVVTYDIAVPRAVQALGSEAPIPFLVRSLDAAGNETQSTGQLKIDDRPPQLPAAALVVTAGVAGEDGNTWFPGAGSPAIVDLALLAVDNGSGIDVASAVLTLPSGDTKTSQNVLVPADAAVGSDGSLHFKVSTSVVAGREGKLHYTIVVKDKLGHQSMLGPADALAIFVDDLAPVVQLAKIQYATASPSFATVCARRDAPGCAAGVNCATGRGFYCGRARDSQGNATRVLRDDSVTVTFTAVDCGSGVATAGATWTAESAGKSSAPAGAAASGKTATGGCTASANLSREFSFTLPLASAAPLLDAAKPDGTTRVRLQQDVLDRVGGHGRSQALTANSPDGDGVVLVSLVRWRAQLAGYGVGAPALLPSAGTPRVLVVASDFAGAPNLFLFEASGNELSSLNLDGGIAGDVAVGQKGTLYMPGSLHNGVSEVEIAAAVDGGLVAVGSCHPLSNTLGAPVALTAPDSTGYENVSAVPTVRGAGLNPPNFLAYRPVVSPSYSCSTIAESPVSLPSGANDLTGVSVSQPDGGTPTAFGSHGAGFSSVPLNTSSFGSSTDYNNAGSSLYAPAAPAIYLDGGAPDPIFGAYASSAPAADAGIVRDAVAATSGCPLLTSACWKPGPLSQTLDVSHTPLFAGGYAFATDDKGAVQAFPLSGGGPVLASAASTAKISAPLLLGNAAPPANQLVVVQSDGRVRALTLSPSPGVDTTILTVAGFPARPPTPVADARQSGSVIYVIDGGGCSVAPCSAGSSWVWALQSDAPPLAASSTSWVRPGRDSCNTRNAQAACP